jgi:hypothetical protein
MNSVASIALPTTTSRISPGQKSRTISTATSKIDKFPPFLKGVISLLEDLNDE